MVVNNGKLCFGKCITSGSIDVGELKWSDGTGTNTSLGARNDLYLSEANTGDNQRGVHIKLGVGAATPTEEDIWLAETEVDGVDINTIITCSTASMSSSGGNPVYTFTFYNNSSTETYTVKEICLCTDPSKSGLSRPTGAFIMLARKVLAMPRTIAPHETVVFAYEIVF